MTSDNERDSEADGPQSSEFRDAERSDMEGHTRQQATTTACSQPGPTAGSREPDEASPERTPWMAFMARHLFDDIDPATLALDEEGPEDEPE
jgi:hypothetical protein